MSEPFMPTVDLSQDQLVKVDGGEIMTWAEAVKRLSASAPSQGAGIGREYDLAVVLQELADEIAEAERGAQTRKRPRKLHALGTAKNRILALLEPRP